MFVFFFCSHWSLVDVPLIFFCPADHVPDWQPRVLLGMVEARSVNVKKTTTAIVDPRLLPSGNPVKYHAQVVALYLQPMCVCVFLKKNLNAPRPSEHPPVRGKKCQNV